MGGYVGGPEFKLLLYLQQKAARAVEPPLARWALERRHPDGRRWIVLARFASKEDAERARSILVEDRKVGGTDLRIRKVRASAG